MLSAAFHTSRHYILFTAMVCLCVLLGGPSYAAGADSLFIAGATYCEPGDRARGRHGAGRGDRYAQRQGAGRRGRRRY